MRAIATSATSARRRLVERVVSSNQLRALWARQWAAWIRRPLNVWKKVTSDAIFAELELKARRRRRPFFVGSVCR